VFESLPIVFGDHRLGIESEQLGVKADVELAETTPPGKPVEVATFERFEILDPDPRAPGDILQGRIPALALAFGWGSSKPTGHLRQAGFPASAAGADNLLRTEYHAPSDTRRDTPAIH